MFTKQGFALIVAAVFCAGILAGCSENSGSTQQILSSLDNLNSADGATSAVEYELSLINAGGINLDSSKGLFSLEWGQRGGPMHQEAGIGGRALAVGFDGSQQQGPPFLRAAVDMGTVYLNYESNHLELWKRTGPRGGISYSSFSGPMEGGMNTSIDFVGDGSYEFEVTGSDKFSAIRTSVTTPSALLKIISHSDSQIVNLANDLTLRWEGGMTNGKVLLGFAAPPPHPAGGFGPGQHGGMGPGGPGHRGGMGPGGPPGRGFGPGQGGPPNPLDSSRAIMVRLDNNPGTYTVSAAKLRELIRNTNTARLVASVSQLVVKDVDHDGGKIRVVMRNGNRVMLRTQ